LIYVNLDLENSIVLFPEDYLSKNGSPLGTLITAFYVPENIVKSRS